MLDSETTFSHFQARIGGFRPGSQAAASCFAELSSGSITMYRRLPHLVDAMCRGLGAANINAECPSGNAPTTRVRLRISRIIRSSGLLTAMIRGGCLSVPVDPRPPRNRRLSPFAQRISRFDRLARSGGWHPGVCILLFLFTRPAH
jgi:hypothetical protein